MDLTQKNKKKGRTTKRDGRKIECKGAIYDASQRISRSKHAPREKIFAGSGGMGSCYAHPLLCQISFLEMLRTIFSPRLSGELLISLSRYIWQCAIRKG
jgi:hypothetical protein